MTCEDLEETPFEPPGNADRAYRELARRCHARWISGSLFA